jgi:hypothetical protein
MQGMHIQGLDIQVLAAAAATAAERQDGAAATELAVAKLLKLAAAVAAKLWILAVSCQMT